ncbi:6-phospho-3-hexuloisomerase [Salibacterium salarium]|uniref:6-phospho-3-hexuloisomerase n=1 Tax=Salibacterium salarium TaxID=284579 RepID=A0A3R9WNQ4_9BACI|nr:6-phospho-3-hexuloisomerase [Salibacterium salarium]RSL30286.1 6-phospho-3-hexuloisomerase [Salibacterium salarium]
MRPLTDILETVGTEVQSVLQSVDAEKLASLSRSLNAPGRIFLLGEGRSGLVGKMFAMRLMHGGYDVYVVGETITPSIEANDTLIVLSGSGKTASLLNATEKAKETGAYVLVFSTDPNSPIAQVSDETVHVPAATKYRREDEPDTIQPLGNQFDQSLHLLLDALVIYAQSEKGTEGNDAFFSRHSNLE